MALTRRSVGSGVIGAVLMAAFYIAVVRGASGSWTHLWDQVRLDWVYLTLILGGFGTQVALVAELRYRHRLDAAATAAGGVGAGASTVGMVACCAHHIADLLPFIGATGAAAFLTDYRLPFHARGDRGQRHRSVLRGAAVPSRPASRGRIIVDVEWVPKAGGEANTAMGCFTRITPQLPGMQGVIYDTALRGVHHQTLLRDLGLLPVNRVAAAKASAKKPRKNGKAVPKSAYIEDKTINLPDNTTTVVHLYARGGSVGVGELTDTGDLTFLPLTRVRTHRVRDKNGKYRWYNDYRLPDAHGNGIVTVRLHGNDEDTFRKLNRTENVRPIAADDPDFERLYPRRNDAESINRGLDDSLWLRRAHSLGHERQLLNLLGYALMVNGLALHQHRRRQPTAIAA